MTRAQEGPDLEGFTKRGSWVVPAHRWIPKWYASKPINLQEAYRTHDFGNELTFPSRPTVTLTFKPADPIPTIVLVDIHPSSSQTSTGVAIENLWRTHCGGFILAEGHLLGEGEWCTIVSGVVLSLASHRPTAYPLSESVEQRSIEFHSAADALLINFGTLQSPLHVVLYPGIGTLELDTAWNRCLKAAQDAEQLWRKMPAPSQVLINRFVTTTLDCTRWDVAASRARARQIFEDLLPWSDKPVSQQFGTKFFSRAKGDRCKTLRDANWHWATFDKLGDPRAAQWRASIVCSDAVYKHRIGRPAPVENVAHGLTMYALALLENGQTWSSAARRHMIYLVRNWVSLPPAPHSLSLPVSAEQSRGLAEVLRLAPWVAFLFETQLPGFRLSLTARQAMLASALAGATARMTEGGALIDDDRRVANWIDWVDADDITIPPESRNGALRACAVAGRDWGDFDQRLRVLPAEVRDSVVAALAPWRSMQFASADDVRLRIDPAQGFGTMANLAVNSMLSFSLGEQESLVLGPFRAVDPQDLSGLLDLPIPAQDALSLRIGDKVTRLRIPVTAEIERGFDTLTAQVDKRLFQGRMGELERIRDVMTRRGIHTPIVIFGNRRAGKTSLAVHALRAGVDDGVLATFVELDVIDGVGAHGSGAGAYPSKLARRLKTLVTRSAAQVNIPLDLPEDDPIELLDELNSQWPLDSPPMGILLDELDSLFYSEPGSTLYTVCERLGNLRHENLVLIATVQRNSGSYIALKEWLPLPCGAKLSTEDAVAYFTDVLSDGMVGVPGRPCIGFSALTNVVLARLGLHPYFWGRLYHQLEFESSATRHVIHAHTAVSAAVDEILANDMFFGSLMAGEDGLSFAEARRKDVFTSEELRLLAEFSVRPAHDPTVNIAIVERLAFGKEALSSLQEREMAVVHGDTVRLTPPLLQEWLVCHALEMSTHRTDT